MSLNVNIARLTFIFQGILRHNEACIFVGRMAVAEHDNRVSFDFLFPKHTHLAHNLSIFTVLFTFI